MQAAAAAVACRAGARRGPCLHCVSASPGCDAGVGRIRSRVVAGCLHCLFLLLLFFRDACSSLAAERHAGYMGINCLTGTPSFSEMFPYILTTEVAAHPAGYMGIKRPPFFFRDAS